MIKKFHLALQFTYHFSYRPLKYHIFIGPITRNRLDGALSNLVYLKMSLLIVGGLG